MADEAPFSNNTTSRAAAANIRQSTPVLRAKIAQVPASHCQLHYATDDAGHTVPGGGSDVHRK